MIEFNVLSHKELNQVELKLTDDEILLEPESIKMIQGYVSPKALNYSWFETLRAIREGSRFHKIKLQGTGTILQLPSIYQFSCISLTKGESLIIHPDCFWACDTNIKLVKKTSSVKERLQGCPSFLTQINAQDDGTVVLKSMGNLELIDLDNDKFLYNGDITAYSPSLTFSKEPLKFTNPWGLGSSFYKYKVLRGTGKILYCKVGHHFHHLKTVIKAKD